MLKSIPKNKTPINTSKVWFDSCRKGGFFIFTSMEDPQLNGQNNLETIKKIKRELVKLGYKPSEVDWIIRTAGGKHLYELMDEQLTEVEKALENQLRIAKDYFKLENF